MDVMTTYRLFLKLPMTLSLLVKCSMGSKAKGSCMLCRTLRYVSNTSRSLTASTATRMVGPIARERVRRTRFHFCQRIFRNPCKIENAKIGTVFILISALGT